MARTGLFPEVNSACNLEGFLINNHYFYSLFFIESINTFRLQQTLIDL